MPPAENPDSALERAEATRVGRILASWKTWPSWARVNALACVVGLLSGFLASALFWGVHFFERVLWQQPLHIPEGLAGTFELGPWGMALILGIPTFGGLAVGLILRYGCPEVAGGGTEQILKSYHHEQALMEGRVVPFKWLASCLTLGTGGAGGNEGPMAQIGAATGSWLAQRLGLSTAERGLLFTAGIAGGIGAIFRAPLGGALFACELYYSNPEFESQGLLPSLIAAVSAYFVFGLVFGYQALVPGDTVFNLSLVNFVALGLTAIICAFGAHAYVGWLELCSKTFKKALPQPWRPGLGGFLLGVLALGLLLVSQRWLGSDARVLAVLGEGYPILNSVVLAGAIPLLLLLVAVGKLLASGLTVGSGGSGGVFAPSMIIGGCLGALVFVGLQTLGYSDGNPKAYVLAGMAAFFAAGTACPLASLIIITEVAQGYHILPALMWVVALGYLLRPRPGLFRDQVPGAADSPVHRAELESAFLSSRTVGQLCRRGDIATLGAGRPSAQALRALEGQRCAPVLDAQGLYLGVGPWPLSGGRTAKTGRGLVDPRLSPLRTDQKLGEALRVLKASQAEELPVLDEQGSVVGLFAYHDIVAPA
ncbi:MAG TPA: chloride channel protein [bacterium]|jgi:CIC family chloride channel protein|nr:chloride channel protein [bacterium]